MLLFDRFVILPIRFGPYLADKILGNESPYRIPLFMFLTRFVILPIRFCPYLADNILGNESPYSPIPKQPITASISDIIISTEANLVTFPINVLVIFLFKKTASWEQWCQTEPMQKFGFAITFQPNEVSSGDMWQIVLNSAQMEVYSVSVFSVQSDST